MPKTMTPIKSTRPTPIQFLRRLGIRREPFTDRARLAYEREIRRAGGDLRGTIAWYGGNSPEAGRVFFINETVAKRTLSSEYDSFRWNLQYLQRLGQSLPTPRRVTDLGGGVGVVGMFLAASHPECRVTVLDHSPTQLRLGRKWAREQNLRRVRFVKSTYAQLAAKPSGGGDDLVLFLRGIDLRLPAPKTGDTSLDIPEAHTPRPCPEIQAPITAISRLLSPTGVGVIGVLWSGWGLVTLFEAIHRAGLGVDWRNSRCRMVEVNSIPGLVDSNIIVRKDMPRLATSSREEAHAFLYSANYPHGAVVLKGQSLLERRARFRDGVELIRADCRQPIHGVDTLRLLQNDGFLLLEGRSGSGPQWGRVDTLSGIEELYGSVLSFLDQCRAAKTLIRARAHKRMDRFARFCWPGNVG